MKTNRRSQLNRADKYSKRAAAMLDRYHWDKADSHFLAIMEASVLTVDELRELTWAQVKNSYEGILILDRLVKVRDEYMDEIRTLLERGKGFYGEELYGSEGSPRLFTKETLKSISKELDQFKD